MAIFSLPARDHEDSDESAEELELPPLDADAEDEGEDASLDELPALLDDDGLDDSDAGDLDAGGDDLETLDDEEDAPEHELDVGPLDDEIQLHAGGEVDGEPEGMADDEGVAIDEGDGDDDGGAEGTDEDPGDEVDEENLPAIDDDADEGDPDALAEALLVEGEAGLPSWAAARWTLLDGAGAQVPCRAVAVAGGRVAAAGEVLLLVDEGARVARRLPFGEGAVAVALEGDALLAATARGQLLTSRDGGAEATSLGSLRAALGPSVALWPAESGASALELVATPGRFWIRAGAALLRSTPLDKAPAVVRDRGVSAIAASAGVLVALTTGAEGPALERFRGDDEGWAEARLTGAARRIAERDRGALRAAAAGSGRCLAVSDQRQIAVSRDAGETFRVAELGPTPALAFAGEGADAPLLALVAPTPTGPAFLVEIAASGEAQRVGEITAPEAEVGAVSPWAGAALAWDASREVVWVACGVGLLALGRPQRH